VEVQERPGSTREVTALALRSWGACVAPQATSLRDQGLRALHAARVEHDAGCKGNARDTWTGRSGIGLMTVRDLAAHRCLWCEALLRSNGRRRGRPTATISGCRTGTRHSLALVNDVGRLAGCDHPAANPAARSGSRTGRELSRRETAARRVRRRRGLGRVSAAAARGRASGGVRSATLANRSGRSGPHHRWPMVR